MLTKLYYMACKVVGFGAYGVVKVAECCSASEKKTPSKPAGTKKS
jgi:hypothetical protein